MTKTTIANRPYGFVKADYEEGDVSTYRGMVMSYTDKKGVAQEERFYTPPAAPDFDRQDAYALDHEAVSNRIKELRMKFVFVSSCDHYDMDIDPELQADMAAWDARQEASLYRAAATCGLVAVVAHRVGLDIGDYSIKVIDPDDSSGEADYHSCVIDWAREQADDTGNPHEKMEALAFLLAAGGDICVAAGQNLGMILAWQNCALTDEEASTPEHQWMHRQDVTRWWALLNLLHARTLYRQSRHRPPHHEVRAAFQDSAPQTSLRLF